MKRIEKGYTNVVYIEYLLNTIHEMNRIVLSKNIQTLDIFSFTVCSFFLCKCKCNEVAVSTIYTNCLVYFNGKNCASLAKES